MPGFARGRDRAGGTGRLAGLPRLGHPNGSGRLNGSGRFAGAGPRTGHQAVRRTGHRTGRRVGHGSGHRTGRRPGRGGGRRDLSRPGRLPGSGRLADPGLPAGSQRFIRFDESGTLNGSGALSGPGHPTGFHRFAGSGTSGDPGGLATSGRRTGRGRDEGRGSRRPRGGLAGRGLARGDGVRLRGEGALGGERRGVHLDPFRKVGHDVAADTVVDVNGAAVELDDLLGDGQAQPGAAVVGGPARVQTREALERPRPVLGRDPRPLVAHPQPDALSPGRGRQHHQPSGGAVPHRVVQQVGEDLREQVGIGAHAQPLRDLAARHHPLPGHDGLPQGLLAQLAQLDVLTLDQPGPGLQAGQVEQLRDQPAQPLGLGERGAEGDGIGVGDPVDHVLQHRPERGDRRTELVADVGHQLPALPVHLAQVGGHRVEGAGELADLVTGGRGDPQAVPALGDGLRGGGHLAQRFGHPPREQLHHDQCEHRGHRDAHVARVSGVDADLVDDERRHHGQQDHHAELYLDPAQEVERSQWSARPGVGVGGHMSV